jgi:membrane protein implicated in regulation of membrane protease activity
MSLRVFHAVFILASILCCDFFAFWSIRHYMVDKAPQSYFWMALAAFIASFVLLIYLLWILCVPKRPDEKK